MRGSWRIFRCKSGRGGAARAAASPPIRIAGGGRWRRPIGRGLDRRAERLAERRLGKTARRDAEAAHRRTLLRAWVALARLIRRRYPAEDGPAVAAILARGAAAAAELAAIPDTEALRRGDAALCAGAPPPGAEELARRLARLARQREDAGSVNLAAAAPAELLAAALNPARRSRGRRSGRGAP